MISLNCSFQKMEPTKNISDNEDTNHQFKIIYNNIKKRKMNKLILGPSHNSYQLANNIFY